jgi:ElaB/YqjD/DUF883 family membrane-anchored ribosome-binding protein
MVIGRHAMEHTDDHGNGAHSFGTRAESKVRQLSDAAKQEASHRVHDLGEKAQQRLETERGHVAERLEGVAMRVRQRGDVAGPIGHRAGDEFATRMEAAAGYLHQHHTDEIALDLAAYVKQHPVRSIIAAAVLGYLIGRISG